MERRNSQRTRDIIGKGKESGIGIGKEASEGDKGQIRIWNLSEVAQQDELKESHLLLLGDKGSGKRTLLQAINKNLVRAQNKLIEVDKMGSAYAGLDASFLYVKDLSEKDSLNTVITSDDNLPRLNTWVLQDVEKSDLLASVLKPEDLEQTCAIIMLDFDQPWEMMNALQRWMGVLQDTVFQLLPKLSLQQRDKLKLKVENYVKTYEEPGSEDPTKTVQKVKVTANTETDEGGLEEEEESMAEIKSQMPLPEGVLKVNLGIPIVVVCNKIDLLLRGEKSQMLEANLEFIQKAIRNYCLSYSATLIFAESYQLTNVEILYRYMLHRLYDYEFLVKPQVLEKDQLFIPSGFDSQLLIGELCKGDEDTLYEEKIKKPQKAGTQMKGEILNEDWQTVLANIYMKKKTDGGFVAVKSGEKSEKPVAAQVAGKQQDIKGFYNNLLQNNKTRQQPGNALRRQSTLDQQKT